VDWKSTGRRYCSLSVGLAPASEPELSSRTRPRAGTEELISSCTCSCLAGGLCLEKIEKQQRNPEIRIGDLTATSADAREIVRRLGLVGYPALFDEDEAALASLEGYAEAANANVESQRISVP
jgi:hypothetical protein